MQMPSELAIKLYQFLQDTQQYAVLLLGIIIQYMFSVEKNKKILLLIIVSTVFTYLFIMPMMIDILNLLLSNMLNEYEIKKGSNIENGLYATSTLVSVELLALIINVLPRVVKDRVAKHFGVNRDDVNK